MTEHASAAAGPLPNAAPARGRRTDRNFSRGDSPSMRAGASLLAALEARDRAAFEHARAVGMWSGRLAETLGLDAREQAWAMLAGTLHDVGQIATPIDLLIRHGPLSQDEWEVVQAHAAVGARMLERVPPLRELAPIVRAHHERFDGQGYPDRLSGKRIPLIARVLAVAESFHAMVGHQSYRTPLPVSEAIGELRRCSGTQWDGLIVEAMLSLVEPVCERVAPNARIAV